MKWQERTLRGEESQQADLSAKRMWVSKPNGRGAAYGLDVGRNRTVHNQSLSSRESHVYYRVRQPFSDSE